MKPCEVYKTQIEPILISSSFAVSAGVLLFDYPIRFHVLNYEVVSNGIDLIKMSGRKFLGTL